MRLRWLTVAVLLAGVTAVPAVADPTPSPSPSPSPSQRSPAPEAPLKVTVTELLPRAPVAHGAFEVSGTVKNIGDTAVTDVQVRLKVGEIVTLRSDLHAADTDRPVTYSREGARVILANPLAPGASAAFDIRTDLDALRIRSLGVYPLDVEARGNAGAGFQSLGLAPTWVPFFADAGPRQNRVAVLWPLVDQPHQMVTSTFADDRLATRLASTGRLGRMLAVARGAGRRDCGGGVITAAGLRQKPPMRCEAVPITYGVDPDLLAAAATMTSGYRVAASPKAVAGQGGAVAEGWLDSLREGLTTGSAANAVLALPYADPDVTALTRTSGGRDDVALATVLGRSTVGDVLPTTPLTTVAWPPAGPITQGATDALAGNGATAFVLDESAYGQPDSEPDSTPQARTILSSSATGTELDGLVVDSDLSRLVLGPESRILGPRLAEQRFLAETAIIATQRPGEARTFLIAPDRHSDASVAASTAALRDLGRVPWLCPVTLGAVAAGTERCVEQPTVKSVGPADRGTLRSDRANELPASYLSGIAADRDVVAQLTDAVLSDAQDTAVRNAVAATKLRLRQAVARAESSAWRSDATGGQASASALHTEVGRLVDRLVVRGGKALLTSSKGTLQVSVENTLDVPVDVRVRFSSKTATLSNAETGLVQIPAGHAVQAGVKAEAQRSGQFVVFAQIVDRNGEPFGQEAEVIVRSTRFGRLALAVTAGGFGVLLIAAGVRVARRAVRARR